MPRRAIKMLSDYPDVLIEFAYDLNDEMPETLTAGSDHIVYWRCPTCKGVYTNSPYHKVKDKNKCPYCQNKMILKGLNDLESKRLDTLLYWDYNANNKNKVYPDNVMYCSNKEVYWKCGNGHSFKRKVNLITSVKSFHCPECDRIKSKQNKAKKEERALIRHKQKEQQLLNNLENNSKDKSDSALKAFINLEQYYDNEANLLRGFDKEDINWQNVYCWKCEYGHTWKKHLADMQSRPYCPICFSKENSIVQKYPIIAKFYDEEKNHVAANEKVVSDAEYLWWKCENGHSFVAKLGTILLHPATGCMYCEKKSAYSTNGWIGKIE